MNERNWLIILGEERIVDGKRYPVVSAELATQEAYERMRDEGTSHNLAEMLALQQAPQIKTDSTFMAGRKLGRDGLSDKPLMGEYHARAAAAAGVSTDGKAYLSQLARFPGDPEAWVNGRGDVQSLCERRGWGCQGDVTVKALGMTEEPKEVGVAPDIVQARVLDKLERDPDLAGRLRADPGKIPEVCEQAREEIAPSWAA